jgi:hypothetical protein
MFRQENITFSKAIHLFKRAVPFQSSHMDALPKDERSSKTPKMAHGHTLAGRRQKVRQTWVSLST